MNRCYSLVTYAFFAYGAYKVVAHHGVRWEFGAYGLPTVLTTPDGGRYLDGAPVEPAIRAVAAAGIEVPVQLGILALVAAWIGLLTYYCRRIARRRQELAALDGLRERKRHPEERKD